MDNRDGRKAGRGDGSPTEPIYEFRLQGYLDRQRVRAWAEMEVSYEPNGVTRLVGPVQDQAALFGLLSQIRDLGIPLISVQLISA